MASLGIRMSIFMRVVCSAASSLLFSRSVMSDSLQLHGLKHTSLPCPAPCPGVYSSSCPLSVMPPNHLILCFPLLLLPSIFPSIRVFSQKPALHIRWAKYWSFSFIISPTNELPGLISLGWTGWISLQFKGLSRVFSNTTVQKHQFSVLSFLYSPTLRSIHDYWKNHRFNQRDLC